LLGGAILAAMVGFRLGVLVANARMFGLLTRTGVSLHLVPKHPDGAGGTASSGNVMLYSTFLLTLTTSALFALGLSANFFWTDMYGQLKLFQSTCYFSRRFGTSSSR
jgi:hypothetical protein